MTGLFPESSSAQEVRVLLGYNKCRNANSKCMSGATWVVGIS